MEENISTVALQPWDAERSKRFSNHALVGRIVSSEKNLIPKNLVKSIINQSWGFTEPVETAHSSPPETIKECKTDAVIFSNTFKSLQYATSCTEIDFVSLSCSIYDIAT